MNTAPTASKASTARRARRDAGSVPAAADAAPAPAQAGALQAARPAAPRPATGAFATTALVLQGGGALGAYQAGVVEALLERDLEPDWVAGISIGAINSALVAGNPRATRLAALRGFWETICRPAVPLLNADLLRAWVEAGGDASRRLFSGFEAWRTMVEGKQGFFAPRGPWAWAGGTLPASAASYYDIAQLKTTLERFVDFDRINDGPMRLSVSAVDVQSGNFVDFDSREGEAAGRIRPEHIMASGALPPGFPAVEIDGRWYWDGGLVSNTPLWRVLEACRRQDTLVFQVDLWSASGPVPTNVYDAQERMKDIQFSSRTRAVTDSMARQQKSRDLLRELLALIPPERLAGNPWVAQAEAQMSLGQFTVIQLIYRDKSWEGHAKDYEFSQLTMLDHWASGLADARRALAHEDWLVPDTSGRSFRSLDDGRG